MTGRGSTVLVVNGASRRGAEAVGQARAALRAHGVRVSKAYVVPDAARLQAALRAALERRPARLLVGGGDGTISAAANMLAGTDVALGVLPLGTGNDFARSLGVPPSLDEACALVAGGEARRISVGIANGRVFLNALSFGVSSLIARRLTQRLKRTVGPLAYPLAAATEALRPEPFALVLRSASGVRELRALQVVVGNGRYHGGGALVAPEASLDDDALDVYVVQAEAPGTEVPDRVRNALLLARVGLRLRQGRHLDHPNVLHLRCRDVSLEATPAQEVDADGETAGETPVECRVAPRLLAVLAPRQEPARRSPPELHPAA